jgi:hypothetical protein
MNPGIQTVLDVLGMTIASQGEAIAALRARVSELEAQIAGSTKEKPCPH